MTGSFGQFGQTDSAYKSVIQSKLRILNGEIRGPNIPPKRKAKKRKRK